MIPTPTSRTRALETLLARIQRANACLVNCELWNDRGRDFASAELAASMDAEQACAERELAVARPALDALVIATRDEAPAELDAWVDAHDAYLSVFIDECAARGDVTEFAITARATWAEVGAGTRSYVEDTGGVTESAPELAQRYRRLFGIDPATLGPVFVARPDWLLKFRPSPSTRTTVDACARALAASAGVVVTIESGELVGNPRDFYGRTVTITASSILAMTIRQSMTGEDDLDPITDLGHVTIKDTADTSFAGKLALWHALRDQFATIGCDDVTLATSPATIVDEAIMSGESELATRLRKDITTALVAEVATQGMIDLRWTRPDDFEAVLAAYPTPLANGWVTIDDCGLTTLPAGLVRFGSEIVSLRFQDRRLDGRALRGVSLPALTRLDLGYCGLRTLSREDLAGFPALVELVLDVSRLEALDADIISTCPRLTRVSFDRTPFARKADAVAALRARWTGVNSR